MQIRHILKASLLVGTLFQACSASKDTTSIQSYYLKEITYRIADPYIEEMVKNSQQQSLLKPRQSYSEKRLGKERVRIEKLVRNSGYNNFDRKRIYFKVDTTLANQQFRVVMVVSRN